MADDNESGGFWSSLLGAGAAFASFELEKDALENERLTRQYDLLEAQSEAAAAADVSPAASIRAGLMGFDQKTLIIAGALLFSGLIVLKVLAK